jgi:hypothetical protein
MVLTLRSLKLTALTFFSAISLFAATIGDVP